MDITPDEYMVVCISRSIEDGELVAQGIATPLIAAAYLLARETHAPNLYFMSAIGQGICRIPAPLSLASVESLWLDRSLTNVGFVRAIADILPRLRPIEYFRPAQVDPYGNFNNIAIGKNFQKPRLRLPGTGGIPDLTPIFNDIYLYVPRHSRLTFVPRLDFISGLGYNLGHKQEAGLRLLVTDLGQFDFNGSNATGADLMRLLSIHPGVTISQIESRTGFEFAISSNVQETMPPTEREIQLLREEIDPLGIRKLEMMSGPSRKQRIHEIILAEMKNPAFQFNSPSD